MTRSLVMQQGLGHCLGGGADVENQRAAVGNGLGNGTRNAHLAFGMQYLALGMGQILHGGAGYAHAAMKAHQQAGIGQLLDVAAHGLQRHPEDFGQLLYRGGLAGADFFDKLQLAWIAVHDW